ncbi:SprT-like domain-containing protein [uncultured Clostridium sp.]|uniref:SprT-like domain-containing protein n=1 Tax=uncultured Clostridium sp. TaxID=59620 RepID=UPI0025F43220|nr:SprT-like domain-containing protein [uncultured Clostridium sp.]
MYKVWSIADIKIIINEISEKWNYPCDIKIEISKRAKKRMGAFFYKKYNNKIEPLKFVFAEELVNGNYSERVVKEVIIHEYLHYYCNTITNSNNGHNKFFKTCCIKSGISSSTTFKYNSEAEPDLSKYKYKIYCSNCKKLVCMHVRKDAAERKIRLYVSKCCNEKLFCDKLL